MTSPRFPEPPPSIPPTPLADVDAAVQRVRAKKDAWVKVGVAERIALLERLIDGVLREAQAWARSMSRMKGIDETSVLHGEDWIAGPCVTARNLRQLVNALKEGGQPKPPKLLQRPDGQWVAEVLPWGLWDKLSFTGWKGTIWIEPGKPPSQGRIYREPQETGKLALVLAAGNVTSIGPMDVLYKLFAENEVVVMKMNPVNEVGGPHIERAFAALIEAGYLAVVYGGGDVGKHLTDHPLVDTIHITGSDRTHDLIIWGSTPDEQEKNKKAGTPRLQKPISSELGCVTPVLVLPGPWTDADIARHADQIAGMVTQNGSFNCNAAKVVVTWKNWPLRDKLIGAIEDALRRAPPRKAYYPGAEQRYKNFVEKYPNHKVLGTAGPGIVPWTLLPGVPANKGEYALTNEAFCGVLADCALDAADEVAFFDAVLSFANDACWGTLSCMVMVHPATEKKHAAKFDHLIANLRYGGIAVNGWAGGIYGMCQTTWGAFPGHALEDIQSGRGVVHNTLLFDHPQKSVLQFPWNLQPKAVWAASHKTLRDVGPALLASEAHPGVTKLPRLIAAALRG